MKKRKKKIEIMKEKIVIVKGEGRGMGEEIY